MCSYVVPTQQLVLATYFFLFLLAIESIAVYHIVCRYEKQQEARVSGCDVPTVCWRAPCTPSLCNNCGWRACSGVGRLGAGIASCATRES